MANYNYTLNGRLQMTDDETGEFEIVTENGTVNVSRILDNIFESGLRPQVDIRIMEGSSLLIEESGGLFYCRDKQGVDSYMVCGINISKFLWDHTDRVLELVIKRGKVDVNGKCEK